MTCIVGLVDNTDVYIGGDSAATGGNTQVTLASPKVFRNGEFLIGVSGSIRMLQVLQHVFSPPKPEEDEDILTYMIAKFVPAMRTCFTNNGYGTVNNGEAGMDSQFIVGYRGRLFTIYQDYQVTEVVDGYSAVGSGGEFARGSLHTTTFNGVVNPEARITAALDAASYFDAYVRPPYKIEKL